MFGRIIAPAMPKWLKGMVAPTLMLWLCAIAFGVAYSVPPNGEISKRADLAFQFALPLVIASWVTADARKRDRQLCYDYDSFVLPGVAHCCAYLSFADPGRASVSHFALLRCDLAHCDVTRFCGLQHSRVCSVMPITSEQEKECR
jgi:hypothetical protein